MPGLNPPAPLITPSTRLAFDDDTGTKAAGVRIVCDRGAGADAVAGGEFEHFGAVVHVLAVGADAAVTTCVHAHLDARDPATITEPKVPSALPGG